MKTVTIKLTEGDIVFGYIFSNVIGNVPTESIGETFVAVVPPTCRDDCAFMTFVNDIYHKDYDYIEISNSPYINLGKKETNEIIKKLPEMIKVVKLK